MNYLNDEIVYGKNPVLELLKSGKPVNKVLILSEGPNGRNQEIIALLHEKSIPYQFVDRQTLDRITDRERHQGMLAYIAAREYSSIDDILALAEERQEDPFILMLDEIEDPHNLGALLRTVDAVGAHGVIIPKRRSVTLTGTVAKTSAGAVEYVRVARVSNLVQALQELKKRGCWVSGAEAGGRGAFEADLTGARVIVIGSEGKGISRLLREKCDEIVSLPMKGQVTSLNASVAGSVMLYEVLRQRISSTNQKV
ncbi:23S rRNA (guanosine(2251)-2'-O)-methyltransferase RlmB [Desulfosporosinus sp. BG]|uniref:23S rRNA (guanosine(2251)-2'-O)-methyltransferase RlmB n=1 Tax=Desulfosporosinus sp. BG TaxID=1633135 RepID=UPI000A666642|nr:23S rRNA (guanosine(2251)-2'-O)-methyltransferase RlmB [Desulfosporosinus sp. BG]